MSGNRDYEALIDRLRDELTRAEEAFRLATTPESKTEALDRFEEALDRYSRLLLRPVKCRSPALPKADNRLLTIPIADRMLTYRRGLRTEPGAS